MVYSVSLAQKYRPNKFSDVLNQEITTKILKKLLEKRKFSSPFMFTGFYGGGKTTLARLLARAILCENLTSDFEPCNECESCVSFLEESNLSYKEIDAASNSGVDDIRKLKEEANSGVLGKSDIKVTLIDECQSITTQGNQALLKQLEDYNPNHIYLFCTTAPESMLPAVRSRCFEFNLRSSDPNQIAERLDYICKEEGISYEGESLKIIAESCFPHIRDCIKTLDYLSNLGTVTEDLVRDNFNLNTELDFLNLIYNLKDNVNESLIILKKLQALYQTSDIYENLIKTCLKVIKKDLGLDLFKNKNYSELSDKISSKFGYNVNRMLEEFLKRNKYSDSLTVESDLILINEKIATFFNKNFEKKAVEAPVSGEVKAVSEENSEELNKKEEVTEDIGDSLEETSQVLRRYKAYPEPLAMLMDKGKKSSSIKNPNTVELSKNVKDFKKNIDRDDIREYLRNKGL